MILYISCNWTFCSEFYNYTPSETSTKLTACEVKVTEYQIPAWEVKVTHLRRKCYNSRCRDRPKSLKVLHCLSSATDVNVTGPRRWPLQTDVPCHSRCGTLKNPHCSMAISAEYRSNYLQAFTSNCDVYTLEKTFSCWTRNTKQINKSMYLHKQIMYYTLL